MRKHFIKSSIFCLAILGFAQLSNVACANNMPYEPVFEAVPISEPVITANSEPVKTTVTKVSQQTQPTVPSVEADNLQNALVQLDSAQVEIRNQLLQYRGEYTELDNQYKLIKEQRKLKARQVRLTEKKIKNLDATKERIRKNMN